MRTSAPRFAAVSLSALAVVGLAACGSSGGDSPSVAAPVSSSSATPSSPSSTTSQAPSSSSSSSSSSAPSSSSSSSSTRTASDQQASGALPAGCGTTLSPSSATFKLGQPAVYKDNDKSIVCMTPKKLTVAPDSVYGGQVLKSSGTVYFLTVNYANVNGDPTKVHASDINQLELHPNIDSGQKGKTFYSSVPGCNNDSDYDDIPAGKSQDTCIPYQISGAKSTSVVYSGYPENYTWK